MGLLGRLGNVGQVLLQQQLKDDEKKQETEALYRQQQQLQASGILGTMAQHVGEKAAGGQPVDYSKLPPGIADIIRGYQGVAPSDQQKTGELVGEWGKIAKPEGAPTREEVLAQMQGKGINTGDVVNLAHRQQFSDANGSYGDGEEGLLPAFTRGAAEENPLVTQAGTAAGAIRGRLQQGVEDAQKRAIDTEAQKKLLPGRPEIPGGYQLDMNGKVVPGSEWVMGSNGRSRPATPEDMTNPDIKWLGHMPQSTGNDRPYYTLQPVYDPSGRPAGGVRLEGRTGKLTYVGADQIGGALKGPPGNLGEQTIGNEASLDALDNLKAQFDAGAKALVGPVEGRLRVLGQKIPGVPTNEEFANFDAASSAFTNSVIKAITGAQMSEVEATRIKQQIPLVTDKADVWKAKEAQTRKNLKFLEQRTKTPRADMGQKTPSIIKSITEIP